MYARCDHDTRDNPSPESYRTSAALQNRTGAYSL